MTDDERLRRVARLMDRRRSPGPLLAVRAPVRARLAMSGAGALGVLSTAVFLGATDARNSAPGVVRGDAIAAVSSAGRGTDVEVPGDGAPAPAPATSSLPATSPGGSAGELPNVELPNVDAAVAPEGPDATRSENASDGPPDAVTGGS